MDDEEMSFVDCIMQAPPRPVTFRVTIRVTVRVTIRVNFLVSVDCIVLVPPAIRRLCDHIAHDAQLGHCIVTRILRRDSEAMA